MLLRLGRQGLVRYVTEGISRKFSGREKTRGRIVILENPELGFDLGPLLAKVLRVPHVDARGGGEIPPGRVVVSASAQLPCDNLIDLGGTFGEYLLDLMMASPSAPGMTKSVDIRIEALKQTMQQLSLKKRL